MHQGQIVRAGISAVLIAVVVGCMQPTEGSPIPEMGRISGAAVAGPICPVVTIPPESGCDDRPVVNAMLVIVNDAGDEVATVTSGADGRFGVDLPPGRYELRPQPVDGLMGTAPPVSVIVTTGQPAEVTISYDTGIR